MVISSIWRLRFHFLRDENGQAIGIMGITRDITDKVKAEEALSFASLIINNSPVVAVLWENKKNRRAIYVSENSEKVLGYKQLILWPISQTSKNSPSE